MRIEKVFTGTFTVLCRFQRNCLPFFKYICSHKWNYVYFMPNLSAMYRIWMRLPLFGTQNYVECGMNIERYRKKEREKNVYGWERHSWTRTNQNGTKRDAKFQIVDSKMVKKLEDICEKKFETRIWITFPICIFAGEPVVFAILHPCASS